jgi:hypothetical protein
MMDSQVCRKKVGVPMYLYRSLFILMGEGYDSLVENHAHSMLCFFGEKLSGVTNKISSFRKVRISSTFSNSIHKNKFFL